jgi:S-adenosyl methyltransferase
VQPIVTGEPHPEPDQANAARVYDLLLGGSHNFASDRAFAAQVHATWPEAEQTMRANRAFLGRAVRGTHAPGSLVSDAQAAGGSARAWRGDAAGLPEPGGTRVPVAPSHHGRDVEGWPLREGLIFRATEAAVPSARARLRQLLPGWGYAELGEDASVVVCELVTNAVAASAGLRRAAARVLIWLGSDGHCLLVTVADGCPRPPVRLNLEPDAERGRGLALVEAFSSRWGWHPARRPGLVKKVVWAEWLLPSGVGRRPGADLPQHRGRHGVLPAGAAVASRRGTAGDPSHAGHMASR